MNDMFSDEEEFSDEELHDFRGFGVYMDDFYHDFGDGLTEEQIRKFSMKNARDVLAKSCTLEDHFCDIATVRWTIRHRLPLPELVRVLILEYLPVAEVELRGRKLLGLHNGHDYYFKSLATVCAGKLMCIYKNQDLTLAEYCRSLGCPVSAAAPVIKASRCLEDFDFEEEVAVLPSEFAVLVPQTSSPCGSFFDCFESVEDWFEDAHILDDMESDEDMSDGESDEHSIHAPAPKVRKIEQPQSIQEILPQDRDLYSAVRMGVSETVRQLLHAGANPTAPTDSDTTVVSLAKEMMESWTQCLDQLLEGQLCPHQARQLKCGSSIFLHVCSKEKARCHAKMFLEQLEKKKEVLSLLKKSQSVWDQATPLKSTLCSENFVFGRGVRCPDFELLAASLGPNAGSKVCEADVDRLAERMWDLAQKQQGQTLCCRQAEGLAMLAEERRSCEVELREQRERQKARQLELRKMQLGKLPSDLTMCNACHANLPMSAFSMNQLFNKGSHQRRCSSCINGGRLSSNSFRPVASPMMDRGMLSAPRMSHHEPWRSERTGREHVRTMGRTVYPWLTFDACYGPWKFPNGLMQFLKDAGHTAPTTLQSYVWPALIEGRDTVAIAGSGKTLSYLLPGYIKVLRAECQGPGMLVMVPTRELWHQIHNESERYGRPANISTAGVFGESVGNQCLNQCLVSTPRHLNSSTGPAIDASRCQYLVLDGLDQMLSMGFEAQLLELPGCLPQVRQTAVYTTAWSQKVQSVAKLLTKDAFYVHVT